MSKEKHDLFEIFNRPRASAAAPRSNLVSKLTESETSCHFGSGPLHSTEIHDAGSRTRSFFSGGIVAPFGRVILRRPFVAPHAAEPA
jgi:hypothetical protein